MYVHPYPNSRTETTSSLFTLPRVTKSYVDLQQLLDIYEQITRPKLEVQQGSYKVTI